MVGPGSTRPRAAVWHQILPAPPTPILLPPPPPFVCRFFRDRRRINVAMSRARYMCVVVGNKRTLNVPKAKPWGAVLTGYSKTRA